MRYGFTTGSCAAAAAKAAAYMLITGKIKNEIEIETPKGIRYHAEITDIRRSETAVSCAVIKDGGDDPDITTGAHIVAAVSRIDGGIQQKEPSVHRQKSTMDGSMQQKGQSAHLQRIVIDGGYGVGRVTKPGLDQPVGNAAINHVPREMIEKEVREVCALTDETADLLVEISVPEGETLAAQTFNPRLGITGGISILGTSGIVEPMSSRALLETIRVELNQKRAMGYSIVAVSPGNYGLDYMKRTYGYDLDKSVKCSNFIGDTVDMAVEMGFQKMLLTGHIGKLIKVAGGIMNTHSREADCRMELLTAFAIREGVSADIAAEILDCVTTEEAVRILNKTGKTQQIMDYAMERICYYLDKRAKGKMKIDCIMYANEFGELARSKEVKEWFTLLEREREPQI